MCDLVYKETSEYFRINIKIVIINLNQKLDYYILCLQNIFTKNIQLKISITRTPDNSNSRRYLELKLNPRALILLHNLPWITRTFVNSNYCFIPLDVRVKGSELYLHPPLLDE